MRYFDKNIGCIVDAKSRRSIKRMMQKNYKKGMTPDCLISKLADNGLHGDYYIVYPIACEVIASNQYRPTVVLKEGMGT